MTELTFKGKEFVFNHHLAVPFRPLVPHPKKGIGKPSLDGNLIIHGDNLHALKALMPFYAGEVDCIFIDPPYNTGNESWSYNDNVNAPMIKEWLNSNPIGIDDGLRHDKWCAMMWPRLRLLHELLSDEGTLWMTLDDNEVHRAKLIMDELFGQSGLLGTLVWEKADSPRMDAKTFSTSYDFILSYAKNPESAIFQRLVEEDGAEPSHYNQTDEDGRKYYLKPLRAMGGQGETRQARPNLYFPLEAPDGKKVYPKLQDGSDGAWRWSKEKVKAESARIEWRKGRSGWTPYFRIYADPTEGRPAETIWYHKEVGSSRTAKAQIKQIFGEAAFETPKPLGLVERVLAISTQRDSIVLDSFAGSGTTGHAVLTANSRDGGNRQFVLVEMEEYADSLTAERLRRVIKGYKFTGTKKTELLREKVTWRSIEKADDLKHRVDAIENIEKLRFDKLTKCIQEDELVVFGETPVEERAPGLKGEFTYCTLGEPVELDKVLKGEKLPPYDALGAVLFHMATNHVLTASSIKEKKFQLGNANGVTVWLIYKPDLDWLKSPDAALTLARAREIAKSAPDKRHLVFAPARFVSQKLLNEENLPVEFVPLPFALYRIERT